MYVYKHIYINVYKELLFESESYRTQPLTRFAIRVALLQTRLSLVNSCMYLQWNPLSMSNVIQQY